MRQVLRTAEFRRVEALPRREHRWLLKCSQDLTAELKTEHGKMELRPVQAEALIEAREQQGLLGALGVGFGKTLVSLLAPSVINAQRPLLLLPAQLKEITLGSIIPELSRHWKIRKDIQVESYHAISNDRDLLNRLAPDLIICDECHKMSRTNSARTRRLLRYLNENPETKFVGLSGTITRKSIKDYWHILLAALKENAPLPMKWHEMNDWAMALDFGVHEAERYGIGALKYLLSDENRETAQQPSSTREQKLDLAREGYRQRLVETPGVVATSDKEIGSSLIIQKHSMPLPGTVADALLGLRNRWVTPAGEELTDAVDCWRKAREVAMGFYYQWEWEGAPDIEWLQARADWRVFVRRITSRSHKYDTEMLVANACREGKLLSPEFVAWQGIKERANPTTVARWLTDEVLTNAIELATDTDTIVWYEQRAVGQRLNELTRWPLFDGDSVSLISHLEHGGPCLASIKAHGVGVNLQHYNNSLVLTPPSSGATWEQLLGRMHRQGQQAGAVTYTVYQHTPELIEAMDKALQNAEYIEKSIGQKQKLKYATLA